MPLKNSMFKRIKNLLDISRYTVEEVVNPVHQLPGETTEQYYERTWGDPIESSTPDMPFRAATIISMTEVDPFKDFTDETPQQSPDDTTAGDK